MFPNLIETLTRPGVLGLVGQNAERRLRRALESYFRILSRQVATLNLASLAESTSKDLARHAVEMRLQNTLRTLSPLLKTTLEAGLTHGMMAADKLHHFAEGNGDGNNPPPMLTGEEAALWASVHAGEKIAGINDRTLELIADAVETGIEDSLGVNGTARLIRDALENMTLSRAEMIAATEMNAAFSEATIRKLDRMGIEYKRWITSPGNVCDECSENEDASPIPFDQDFPSGDSAPPAHPNCRCAVTGARAPEAA
jgi:hypothetical protein